MTVPPERQSPLAGLDVETGDRDHPERGVTRIPENGHVIHDDEHPRSWRNGRTGRFRCSRRGLDSSGRSRGSCRCRGMNIVSRFNLTDRRF